MSNRLGVMAAMSALMFSGALSPGAPDDGVQVGPGVRKTVRGKRLNVEPTEHTRSKKKSASLSKLLRK